MMSDEINLTLAVVAIAMAAVAIILAYETGRILKDVRDILNMINLTVGVKAGMELGARGLLGIKLGMKLQDAYEKGDLSDEDIDKWTDDIIEQGLKEAS